MKPPRTVYHGTDAAFEQFDVSCSLGAHFGTQKAASDRLKDTGRDRVELFVYTDEETLKIWACERNLHNRPARQHGPFETELLAQQFCDGYDGKRTPDAYEIDVYRPLHVPDLGTWEFNTIVSHIKLHHPDLYAQEEDWWAGWNRSNEAGWNALKASLQAAGYDSIVYVNETEDEGSLSWIVWNEVKIHKAWSAETEAESSACPPMTL